LSLILQETNNDVDEERSKNILFISPY